MKITLTGNKSGIYTDPRTCNSYIDYTAAENYNSVNMDGVNNLCIDRDDAGNMKIFQASGYTPERGLFIDMY